MTAERFYVLEAKKEQLDDNLDEGSDDEGDESDLDDTSGDEDEW